MAADSAGFDARFDPAFQRGFEGSAPEVRALATPVAPAPPPAPPREGFELLLARSGAAASGDGEADGARQGLDDNNDEDDEFDEHRGRNPFLLALAGLSVLLIVGGVLAAQAMSAAYGTNGVNTGIDYVAFSLVLSSVPIAVALGVATGIGVLFVHAVRWNRGGVTRSRSNSRKNGA